MALPSPVDAAERIDVVNLFAYRATKPRALLDAAVPLGFQNDEAILNAVNAEHIANGRGLIVCAWGCPASAGLQRLVRGRAHHVANLLRGRQLLCMGRSIDGSPRHPLLLSYDTKLEPWRFH